MSILLKSGYQVVFIVCDVIEWTMNHGIEFCSEKCRAAVCLQSNEQFVSLQEMLLAICNAQFNASAFIGNPTIQNKKKDIRLENFVSVYCEYWQYRKTCYLATPDIQAKVNNVPFWCSKQPFAAILGHRRRP